MSKVENLRGIVPPILTPLTDDGAIDRESMTSLVNYLIDGGVHGIWATGTTGEFPCFDAEDRALAVRTIVKAVAGRVPIVASIGDCSTNLAIRHAKAALDAGVDAIAATPPHYYMNTQDELLVHYRTIREAVDLPLMVYNIPQTVKVRVAVPTVLTLSAEGTIVGVKDSQNDLDWFRQVMVGTRRTGKVFRGFLGTRILIDSGIIAGAHGAIPSVANVCPALCVAVYERAVKGDWEGAARATEQLGDLSGKVAGIPSLKGALKAMGVLKSAKCALPTRTVTDDEAKSLKKICDDFGVTPRS